jgi:hypothetical protein
VDPGNFAKGIDKREEFEKKYKEIRSRPGPDSIIGPNGVVLNTNREMKAFTSRKSGKNVLKLHIFEHYDKATRKILIMVGAITWGITWIPGCMVLCASFGIQ